MKFNLRLRGAQNVKPKRNKRERRVVENTFRRTQDTAPKRDSKRERLNLVLERKTPKRERKTPKRRFKATKVNTHIHDLGLRLSVGSGVGFSVECVVRFGMGSVLQQV